MTTYKHTQIGYLMIAIVLAVLALDIWISFTMLTELSLYYSDVTTTASVTTMVVIAIILASFSTLTVSVEKSHLKIRFGYGIFKKKVALKEIVSAKSVKNKWYYGWGIRVGFRPRMVIFNVSGLDAVEIKTKKGKIYRIGTDEPQKLEAAIKNTIK